MPESRLESRNSPGQHSPNASGSRRKYKSCIHIFILSIVSLSIVYTCFLTGRLHFEASGVSSPLTGLSLPGVAAAVAPPEEAILHSAVLPLTIVTAHATDTPSPLPLQLPVTTPAESVVAAAAAVPASTEVPASPAPPPAVYIIYTVQEGDTIDGLAARYGISSTSIKWNNLDLENADFLVVGQYLRVPMSDGIIYEIRLGDTLSDIADRFSVDVATVVGFAGNNLASVDGIVENQIIFVPNGAMPAPVSTPAPADEPSSPPSAAPRDTSPAAPAPAAPGPASSAGFIWPVHGPISSYFGPSHPLGIDIDQFNSPGAPILAAASGVVTFAGGNACCSYGLYVVINHQNGFETLYAHMASMTVAQGEYVSQGQVIGYVGLTGYSTGYHLHFEVHRNGAVVNPLDYLP